MALTLRPNGKRFWLIFAAVSCRCDADELPASVIDCNDDLTTADDRRSLTRRLQNYFTKLLEDRTKCVIKPQYVDHIPKVPLLLDIFS